MPSTRSNALTSLAGAVLAFGLGAEGCRSPLSPKRHSDEPTPCVGDVHDLRLWTLSLSHPDTVTLKNTSACPIELEGVEILFDDRDDAFAPDVSIDCTLRLPPAVLPAGASIRISELPFPGELDALAAEVGGCAYPLSFNPDRGGVTYLCDGACDASTLVDVVAHAGDDIDALEPGVVDNRFRDPPAFRFGMQFSKPLRGASKFNDGLVRYQRVATAGSFPDFLASDWALQSRILFADFEDGVTARSVASRPGPWQPIPGEPSAVVTTSETAASFAASLRITHLGRDGTSDALATALDALSSPRDLRYFARATPGATAGNLALLAQSTPLVELGFEPSGVGASYGNAERAETAAFADTWHRIELRDIDWTLGRVDLYVDEIPVGLGLAVDKNRIVDEVRLYAVSAGSTSHFDAVELWGPTYTFDEPDAATGMAGVLRCGVGSEDGGAGGAPSGPTCEELDATSGGETTCESFCTDWDAICCGESFAENYANRDDCLTACATFTPSELCCRARHGRIGGPERCRMALGIDASCEE